jgi:hypothetical protein
MDPSARTAASNNRCGAAGSFRAQFARKRCSGFFRDIAYDQSDAFSGQSFRDAASNS